MNLVSLSPFSVPSGRRRKRRPAFDTRVGRTARRCGPSFSLASFAAHCTGLFAGRKVVTSPVLRSFTLPQTGQLTDGTPSSREYLPSSIGNLHWRHEPSMHSWIFVTLGSPSHALVLEFHEQ